MTARPDKYDDPIAEGVAVAMLFAIAVMIVAMMKPLSDRQRHCLIAATIEPLTPFRRGYARSKAGPFYDVRTVHSLIQTGALRMIMNRAGRRFGTVTARAA